MRKSLFLHGYDKVKYLENAYTLNVVQRCYRFAERETRSTYDHLTRGTRRGDNLRHGTDSGRAGRIRFDENAGQTAEIRITEYKYGG